MELSVFVFFSVLGLARAAEYSVARTYDASNFWDSFYFRSAEYYEGELDPPARDPTNGAVKYLDKDAALESGLADTPNNQVRLAVDSTTKVDPALGRPAIRLESIETFDRGLLVADIEHMPGNSCGTWPAMWTYNMAEDQSSGIPVGEVDFLEGTAEMKQTGDSISLHTGGECSFPGLRGNGDPRPDCNLDGDAEDPSIGCGIEANPGTYGTDFNSGHGGVFAILYADEGITIWFFPRGQIPTNLQSGQTTDPSTWNAKYKMVEFSSGSTCDTKKYFNNQTIIINTTFCGDAIWDWPFQSADMCGLTAGDGKQLCADYVATHPEDYKEAYWLINSVKLYQ